MFIILHKYRPHASLPSQIPTQNSTGKKYDYYYWLYVFIGVYSYEMEGNYGENGW
jgi:hypothetical protein